MGSISAGARRRAVVVAAGLALALVLAGCRPPPDTTALVGRYRVTAIYDTTSTPVPVLPGTVITLELSAGGKLSGRACNTYGGSWALGTGRNPLTVTNLYSTDMACSEPEGVMGQETRYLQNLGDVRNWTRRGATLTLLSSGEPSRPLIVADAV
jgi:heat shock protein HslJ